MRWWRYIATWEASFVFWSSLPINTFHVYFCCLFLLWLFWFPLVLLCLGFFWHSVLLKCRHVSPSQQAASTFFQYPGQLTYPQLISFVFWFTWRSYLQVLPNINSDSAAVKLVKCHGLGDMRCSNIWYNWEDFKESLVLLQFFSSTSFGNWNNKYTETQKNIWILQNMTDIFQTFPLCALRYVKVNLNPKFWMNTDFWNSYSL